MTKQIKKKKENSIEGLPTRKFKILNKTYLVYEKEDDLKVTLDGNLVFDKFNSKLSYIEWIKTKL